MSPGQAVLFEPTGADVGPLALDHLKKAKENLRAAEVFKSRGWVELSYRYARRAVEHEAEAECLGMLAQFEQLGGVSV